MGLKESLEAMKEEQRNYELRARISRWRPQANVACLLARMHPDRCIEYFLDSNTKKIELGEGEWHIIYCLENGRYKVKDSLKYDWKIEETYAPSIRIARIDDKGRFSMKHAGNPLEAEEVLDYLRENPNLKNIPGVQMLAQEVRLHL